ncbi:VOC family protein [Pseudactinotalea sp. Z1732]|uniref:VOC family protein n=1 Tax=Micrococcales TaxID=85006 RepID=UPI003C7ABF42
MAVLRSLVIDCAHPAALARFWAGVLDGYRVRDYDRAEIDRLAALGHTPESDPSVAVDGPGPGFFFTRVPEGKVTKNRMHMDIEVRDRTAAVATLTERGARIVQELPAWTVMADPEGNEFCVFPQ